MKRFALLPAILLACSTFLPNCAHAGSATWNLNPVSGDWNTAANWTPATTPNGPADVATFALSNATSVSILVNTEVSSVVFNPGASAFTITVSTDSFLPQLTISGAGVLNNSGVTQNFVTTAIPRGHIDFMGNATAGSSTIFTNKGGNVLGNGETFHDSSSAASATFVNDGGTGRDHRQGGSTNFMDNSTAANATFINNSGDTSSFGGFTAFFGNSTAASGTFICNGGAFAGNVYFTDTATAADGVFTCYGADSAGSFGGYVTFASDSNAGNATLVANGGQVSGGQIAFDSFGAANGGAARVAVFGNGNLDISRYHTTGGLTIGSLQGNGLVFLGAFTLSIGSNGRDTTFSGVIQDGGNAGGTGGSLIKVGPGRLTLSGVNTYTGTTTVEGGTLLVTTRGGSGVSTGPLQVNAGSLGGTTKIPSPITVGSGSGPGAFLAPGANGTGKLTTSSSLTFNADGSYSCDLNTSTGKADQVNALSVTISSGALFALNVAGNQSLPIGTVFIVMASKSQTPIAGSFANLPDGSTLTIGSNTFQANYEGGDGNDLTLTVVP